jgi:hypothetical protein
MMERMKPVPMLLEPKLLELVPRPREPVLIPQQQGKEPRIKMEKYVNGIYKLTGIPPFVGLHSPLEECRRRVLAQDDCPEMDGPEYSVNFANE